MASPQSAVLSTTR